MGFLACASNHQTIHKIHKHEFSFKTTQDVTKLSDAFMDRSKVLHMRCIIIQYSGSVLYQCHIRPHVLNNNNNNKLSQSLKRLDLHPNMYIQMQKSVILGTCSSVRNF